MGVDMLVWVGVRDVIGVWGGRSGGGDGGVEMGLGVEMWWR